jgi:hypothetical protein
MVAYRGLVDIDSGVVRGKEQLDFRLSDAAVANSRNHSAIS